MITLPVNLEAAIVEALKALPSSQWVSAARSLSERYRAGPVAGERLLVSGATTALAYAAIILPATYAQLSGAMAAVVERAPDWKPRSMLDIGSGPGTALWAAAEHWPGLQSLTAWEREPAFLALGRQLARASAQRSVAGASWQHITLPGGFPKDSSLYDLIVLGHVLSELDESLQREVVSFAWKQCQGVLLIVEPGTSAAFPVVKSLREQLLAQGAWTLAPCAHDRECPLQDDWCHFPQRLNRPAFQRRAKAGSAGWEESKFCYAAMARFPAKEPIWGRLIHQPHLHKGFVEITVSSQVGIVRHRAPKRERDLHRQIRSYRWGDALYASPDQLTKSADEKE